jgi:hypothetical protein
LAGEGNLPVVEEVTVTAGAGVPGGVKGTRHYLWLGLQFRDMATPTI